MDKSLLSDATSADDSPVSGYMLKEIASACYIHKYIPSIILLLCLFRRCGCRVDRGQLPGVFSVN